jgi:PiT family inorganic phosphate transporter
MDLSLVILIVSALAFDFLNGFHDSANIVAAPIASRAIQPRRVLLLAAVGTFMGPFLFGVAVAEAIGTGLTNPQNMTMPVLIASMLAAVTWGILTWWRGIPSSSSHALIGGMLGAIIISSGVTAVNLNGLTRIALGLLISPVLGLVTGFLLMRFTLFLARGSSPRINVLFKKGQIFSSFGLALSHGTNEAQKTMGILTLGLVTAGIIPSFEVPRWVVFVSAVTTAVGTGLGGWRLIRTLGYRIYKLRPIHGFVSQFAGAGVILGAALTGSPVSTTQVMSSAIMGTGSAERISKVRWRVGYELLVAWLITIPVCALLASVFYYPILWITPR